MAPPVADHRPPAPVKAAVAAFDFDGTLTTGGSVWPFLAAVAGTPALLRAALALAPPLVLAGIAGGRWADRAKEALFVRVLGGRAASEVSEIAARFGPAHFAAHRRADTVARLEDHRRAGFRVVIVSASPALYLRPVGDLLGVDEVIATELEVDADGRLTGRYAGENCRGPAKLARVRAWAAGAVAPGDAEPAGGPLRTTPTLWAYGNSAGDAALLTGADVGINAGRLGRFGRLRRFPRLADVPPPGRRAADGSASAPMGSEARHPGQPDGQVTSG
jgi:phosphatidylglycerophosphatase C